MNPKQEHLEQDRSYNEQPLPYDMLGAEYAEEAEETLYFYTRAAEYLSDYRDGLRTLEPQGEYSITPWVVNHYLRHSQWLPEGVRDDRDRVTEAAFIRSTNEAFINLLEYQIACCVAEGNQELDLVVSDAEVALIGTMLEDEWWPDDQLVYAGCTREQWDRMDTADKWRAVADVSSDFDVVKGRPNYFRYHNPDKGEPPVAVRPQSGPYIDAARYLNTPHEAALAHDSEVIAA